MKYETLVEAITGASELSEGITFIEGVNTEHKCSYSLLYNEARKVLFFLQQKGMRRGNELVLQFEDNQTFLVYFWACILGGIIPVPLSVGKTTGQKDKLVNVWKLLHCPYLAATFEQYNQLINYLENQQELFCLQQIIDNYVNPETISNTEGVPIIFYPKKEDIAYVQFSSGSTGSPKGVVLTHDNVIVNAAAILNGINSPSGGDTFFSWMPLTHDMGLVGYHITPLLAGWQHYIMPTELFIRRPVLWLQKISEHRLSFTASPNFGYRFLLNSITAEKLKGIDLSSVRIITNGAEPISADVCKEFTTKLSEYGLKANVIFPVYGLAEATLAVTFTQPGETLRTLTIDRKYLYLGAMIKPVDKETGIEFVNVGQPVNNSHLKITDVKGKEFPDGYIGNIDIKGRNVTSGYYNNPEVTSALIADDGWLNTGDLGFLYQGDLYVTGRKKDIIFVNGQNYYSHDIENTLSHIEGIEAGKVAVGGTLNVSLQKEEVIVFLIFRGAIEKFLPLAAAVRSEMSRRLNIDIQHIIPVREIPKTTSGKLQRYQLIARFIAGDFSAVLASMESLVQASPREIVVAADAVEEKLLQIWEQLFPDRKISVTDSFFCLGGDSLKMTLLLQKVQDEMSLAFSITDVFNKPTIRAMAKIAPVSSPHILKCIPPAPFQMVWPLAPAQRGLYYSWLLDKQQTAYNIPLAMELHGKLDIQLLEKSIAFVINQHDVFNHVFVMSGQTPQQKMGQAVEFSLKIKEVKEDDLDLVLQDLVQPFNLEAGPLYRFVLLLQKQGQVVLFVDFHHIIADGTTMSNLIGHIFQVYEGDRVLKPALQYRDYISWMDEKKSALEQEGYWKRQLGDTLPILQLPLSFPRPAMFCFTGKKMCFHLNQEQTLALKKLAQQEEVSLFMLLLAIFKVLLAGYSGQEDIIVGIPVAGRTHPQLQDVAGMFVNNLPIRTQLAGDCSFTSYLQEVKSFVLEALENQGYQFDLLSENWSVQRDMSRQPLFDVMFAFQNMVMPVNKEGKLQRIKKFFDPGISKYDLTLEIFEESDTLACSFEYATALFTADTIQDYKESFMDIIQFILEHPQEKIAAIPILSINSYKKRIIDYNNTIAYYPENVTVYDLFLEKAQNIPNQIALIDGEMQYTYAQLNTQVNQLSQILLSKGIGHNMVIAIIADPGIELLVAILSTLKSGACYVPLDTNLPEERLEHMIADSQACIILTTKDWYKIHPLVFSRDIYLLDETYPDQPTGLNVPQLQQQDTAYIIYTSGSTGQPKGVAVSHQSLLNYCWWAKKTYCESNSYTFPLFTSISFDLTITSIFVPLITGGIIVAYRNNDKELLIEQVIRENKADIIKLTPSHLQILLHLDICKQDDFLSRLHGIIVGGEELTVKLSQDILTLFGRNIRIYNEYGPTEATVGCMIHQFNATIDLTGTVPIGRPISNARIYLLDKYLRPVSGGTTGELYIGGQVVSKGYQGNPQVTAKLFIGDILEPDEKMYKTGDLARWNSQGQIEFIGRVDRQVKIRGYRIELGEIENKIIQHIQIKMAVVTAIKDNSGSIMLCAYIVPDITAWEGHPDSQKLDVELTSYLYDALPAYMVPRKLIFLDEMPLSKNGKIALEQLPLVTYSQIAPVINQPENEIQEILIEAWKGVLGVVAGIHDNFFELGGDSIKAVQLVSKLSTVNIRVSVQDLLQQQTIANISRFVEKTDVITQFQGIVTGERSYTPIEHWFFEQELPLLHHYNQSVLIRFKIKIESAILQQVITGLFNQHDGLRQQFDPKKGTATYLPFVPEELMKLHLQSLPDCDGITDLELQMILKQVSGSLNIFDAPLIRFVLINTRQKDYLFICSHHLLVDGISWRILLEDLHAQYTDLAQGKPIPSVFKTASLKEWVGALQTKAETAIIETYWQQIAEQEVIRLPKDYAIPSFTQGNYEIFSVEIEKTKLVMLQHKARVIYNTGLDVVLMTIFLRALQQWSDQNQFLIEMEHHGRSIISTDVSRTVGWFTALFPVLIRLSPQSIGEQLKTIKEQLQEVPANGAGYGILRYLKNGSNQLIQQPEIRFNYLGVFGSDLDNELFSYCNMPGEYNYNSENTSTVLLEVNSMVIQDELKIELRYNATAWNQSTIHQLVNNLKSAVDEMSIHLMDEEDIHFTSSDFSMADMDQEDLDKLFLD